MPDLERGQMISALFYLIIALFLAGGVVSRHRHQVALRRASIALYAVAVVVVIGLVALWLAGGEL